MNSMTGFGAASVPFCGASLRVEISGINRKQLECAINLPRPWAELEPQVREFVAQRISRGRVSVFAAPQSADGSDKGALHLHRDKLEALQGRLEEVKAICGRDVQLSVDALLRLGVLTDSVGETASIESVWKEALLPALQQAMEYFLQMRAQEGANLARDLWTRVTKLHELRAQMLQSAVDVPARYRESLLRRLIEQGLVLDEPDERLVKELALFADKCDVSEEMTRLHSHLQQFEKFISRSDEAVGRPLDFLCQEIFRELNTTGSKANSAELAQLVVTAKTELEKIREQVQNVE